MRTLLHVTTCFLFFFFINVIELIFYNEVHEM